MAMPISGAMPDKPAERSEPLPSQDTVTASRSGAVLGILRASMGNLGLQYCTRQMPYHHHARVYQELQLHFNYVPKFANPTLNHACMHVTAYVTSLLTATFVLAIVKQ